MRYRRLSANGDMTFGNQQADFHRDSAEGVAQAVVTRLKLWFGEWFIDQTEGTPYSQAVLGKYTKESIEPVIRSRILQTENVTEITEFDIQIDPDTRTANIQVTIDTAFGQTQVIEVL